MDSNPKQVLGMLDLKGISRFFKYSLVGGGTFLFDLLLLYVAIDVFGVHYLVATVVAYLIAVSLNFLICSRLVFRGYTRNAFDAYGRFMSAALVALFVITVLMFVAVEVLGMYYFVARIGIAGVIGFGNYLFNLYLNFKVQGKHG